MEEEKNLSALAPAEEEKYLSALAPASSGGTEAERMQSEEEDAGRDIVPTGEAAAYIPFHVVTNEVLSKTDEVKPLMRMKLVCKEWNHLIQDPKFIENHMKRGKGDSMLYFGMCNGNNPDPAADEKFLCGCNGMIVVRKMKRFLIQNPATQEERKVPTPSRDALYGGAMMLAFVPTAHHYKLLSVFFDGPYDVGCKVLTVGVDPSWRPVNLQVDEDATVHSSVSTGTVAHILLIPYHLLDLEGYSTITLVSFDFGTETLTYTVLERDLFEDWGEVGLTNWNGQGAITHVGKEEMRVILIGDHRGLGHTLADKKQIPLCGQAKLLLQSRDSVHALVAHKDIVWVWLGTKMMGFALETGEIVHMWSIPGNYTHFDHTLYVGTETLAAVPGMKSIERGRPA